MMKGKVNIQVHIFNARINTEFDAEILDDGSLKLTYHDAIIIPAGHFSLATVKDWR